MSFTSQQMVLWVATLALAACAGPGLDQRFVPAESAIPQVGERWTYQVRNGYNGLLLGLRRWEVTSAGAGDFEVRIIDEPSGEMAVRRLDASWNPSSGIYPPGLGTGVFWSGISPGAPVRYAPFLPLFRFPLAAGQHWRERVSVIDPTHGKQKPVLVVARVDGMESVTVPAGRFDAVKVTRNLYYQDGEWWRSALYQQITDWFAPSVNRIVRRTERSRYTDYSQGGTDGSVVIVDGDYWVEELLEPARVSR